MREIVLKICIILGLLGIICSWLPRGGEVRELVLKNIDHYVFGIDFILPIRG